MDEIAKGPFFGVDCPSFLQHCVCVGKKKLFLQNALSKKCAFRSGSVVLI